MVDASPEGYGVVERQCPLELVQRSGRVSERWRWKNTVDAPREHAFAEFRRQGYILENKGEQLCVGTSDFGLAGVFNELPVELLLGPWKVAFKGVWRRTEPMVVLEARCALLAVKHLVRSSSNFNKRVLVVSDSIAACAAISKGRSATHPLLGICPQLAALSLGCKLSVQMRWVPSEANFADGPSRGLRFPYTP
eukprot:3335613-Amphidinium_carterae.1